MKKTVTFILCAVLLAGLIFGVAYYQRQAENEQIENAGISKNAPQKVTELEYQGAKYPLKKHIQTVLLIGTDSEGNEQSVPEGFTAFYNFSQADFIVLLVLDNDAKSVEMIQINRDTMTDVPWLDVIGQYGGTNFEQLCLSFNSGSGGTDSCQNTVNAVSNLLFDAPIQGFIQIPMSAIPVINDLVGGVSVTITDDMTPVDPAFIQGTTVLLKGTQAEKFVRARQALENDTNLARMRRQRDYMDSLQKAARDALNSDPEFVMKMLDKLSSLLQSNLSGQQMTDLLDRLDTYQISPIRYAEGELVTGSKYYEFYVDEASLWEIVKASFCQ